MKEKIVTIGFISAISFICGCSVIKSNLKEKALPVAEREIPKIVEKYFAERLEKDELTEKQAKFLKEETYKFLTYLDEKVKIYLSK